jgi:NAD(P)-dependent dehydrogenase (short-subunit alcohol dehydrogenase family)
MNEPPMQGRVVVISGATSGIGKVAAEQLAQRGARLVMVARDPSRGAATLERLRHLAPGAAHSIYYADLSRLSEMKRIGREVAQAEPRIDVLINNAGAMFGYRQITEDGLERTFALNHMAYFVLTHLLRERLLASAPARVVNTSSNAHQGATLNFDDLQSEQAYNAGFWSRMRHGGAGFLVYGRSKLCNILFTRELARRLAGTGVTANCLHPGFVDTRFGDQSGGLMALGVRVGKHLALSPRQGAETLIYLAASQEVANVSGKYFYRCRLATPTAAAQDAAAAERLWLETARLAHLDA